ncbi:MAG: D-alanine--D-alanine ligase [Phycisphaerae bacterium]|jgi:D-alanine-D-alanine ligase
MDFNIPPNLKIAVLKGASGSERQISLVSGGCIAEALRKTKLVQVVEHDYNPDKPEILDDKSIDVFFLAFHGQFGEGGEMQQLCEQKKIVYTGCGPEASRLCFDKIACKKAVADAGEAVPKAVEIASAKQLADCDSEFKIATTKFVVKPVCEGSSVGVSIVEGLKNAKVAAEKCLAQFGRCMIEEFITGREIAVGVLGGKTLPIIEIRTSHQFYDYNAKYDDDNTQYLFDTIQDEQVLQRINAAALKSFKAAGCRDFSRVDMIVNSDGTPYMIEINTIPGFTTHSLLPKAAAKAGVNMEQLCLAIIKMAIERKI